MYKSFCMNSQEGVIPVTPKVILSPVVARLLKLVLGQLHTHALPLGISSNPSVTFEQNICCFTGLAKPFCRSELGKWETVSPTNLTPLPDWLVPCIHTTVYYILI